MKRYTVEVRMPMIYTVEVEAMNEAEARQLAQWDTEAGAVDEGYADGLAVVVSVEAAS
jgi:hypothetical protein